MWIITVNTPLTFGHGKASTSEVWMRGLKKILPSSAQYQNLNGRRPHSLWKCRTKLLMEDTREEIIFTLHTLGHGQYQHQTSEVLMRVFQIFCQAQPKLYICESGRWPQLFLNGRQKRGNNIYPASSWTWLNINIKQVKF